MRSGRGWKMREARELTHLSLFSGIGGLDLAAERAGFRSVGQCEWADYQTKVLERHWPAVPRWRDIRTLTKESFYERTGLRTVDLISGGFPCQPFSTAGMRRGCEDDRYLWPEMLRVIEELRPDWVVGENVAGIVNMALDTVLSDLESLGYACQAFIIPACAVDAPHRRDRCAIVAYSDCHAGGPRRAKTAGQQWQTGLADGSHDVAHTDGTGQQRRKQHRTPDTGGQEKPHRPTCKCGQNVGDSTSAGFQNRAGVPLGRSSQEPKPERPGGDVPDTNNRRGIMRRHGELPEAESLGRIRGDYGGRTPEYGGGERRTTQSGMGGGYDGLSSRMDGVRTGWADGSWEYGIERIARGVPERVNRLKCLGNAVVPAQFYPIFQAIADIERSGV